MKTVIEMARSVGARPQQNKNCDVEYLMSTEALEAFADLVRADERWLSSQRRGVLMFSPYTGIPRHPSDIASDPHGILMLDPDQPIRGLRINT